MNKTILMAALLGVCSSCVRPPENRPVVAAFVRQDCPPCVLMHPWIDKVRGLHGDWVDVAVVDVEEEGGAGLASYFGIIAIPSQVYIDATGHVVEFHAGIDSFEGMEKRLGALAERAAAH